MLDGSPRDRYVAVLAAISERVLVDRLTIRHDYGDILSAYVGVDSVMVGGNGQTVTGQCTPTLAHVAAARAGR